MAEHDWEQEAMRLDGERRTLEDDLDSFREQAKAFHSDWQKARAERDALKLRVAALEAALRELSCLGNGDRAGNSHGNVIAQRALSGDTTALRALLVEAVVEAWEGRGYPAEGAASKSALAKCIADRILGANKGSEQQDHTNQERS